MNPEIWRYVFDAIEDLAFLHDMQFRILHANRAYCREAGVTEAEALGKPYWEVFPPGTGPLPGCKDAASRKGGDGGQEEVHVGAKLFLSKSYTVRDDKGKLLHSLHLLSDITAQRRAKAALTESEQHLRSATETARDAIITIAAESGTVTAWNPAAEAMFGYGKEEAIGRGVHEFLPPARFREAATKGMAHFATTGEGEAIGKTLELAALHKDGTEFPIELSLSAMQVNGKWYATGITRDISERKQVETALRDSESQLQAVVEGLTEGLAVSDLDGQVLHFNRAALDMHGFATLDECRQHLNEFADTFELSAMDGTVWPVDQWPLARILRGESLRDLGVRVRNIKAGWQKIFSYGGSLVLDAEGHSLMAVVTLSDISERKQAELHLARLNRMYRTISHCNQALVHTGDELELAREICRVLVEEGSFSTAWVGYAETGDAKRILPVAVAGGELSEIAAMNLSWDDNEQGHGPTGTAIRTGNIMVSHDILNDSLWAPWREQAMQRGYAAAAAFPLQVNGQVLGALDIYSAEDDVFAPDMLELLTELAGDLAFGIGNFRAQAERMGILEKLEHSLDHAVTAIAATVEMRDPYTAGHQRRVAKLAAAIAIEMGLPVNRVQGLHMACVVHDIGKIHVPAEILSSPAKLSDAEFEIIKTHPLAGWEILKGIDFPWPVAEMVYQHHEKLDGSGYPRGLKGDEILLEARILAVADVVEAMTSHRPYRPGFGVFRALQEISRNKGKLYDTAAAEACLRVFMENDYEWEAKVPHA